MLRGQEVEGEKEAAIKQFQKECEFLSIQIQEYKKRGRSNELAEKYETLQWYTQRLSDCRQCKVQASSIQTHLDSHLRETTMPYGPEGDGTSSCKALPRQVIPYGPPGGARRFQQHRVLLFGLPKSGKQTILSHCKIGVEDTETTVANQTHKTLRVGQTYVSLIDIRTDDIIPETSAPNVHAVIFVVCSDSTEKEYEIISKRIELELKTEYVHKQRNEGNEEGKPAPEPKLIPLLVFFNTKQTSNEKTEVSAEDVIAKLKLKEILERTGPKREWHIQLCNAKENQGLYEGIDWLKERVEDATVQSSFHEASQIGCVMQ